MNKYKLVRVIIGLDIFFNDPQDSDIVELQYITSNKGNVSFSGRGYKIGGVLLYIIDPICIHNYFNV